MVNLPIPSAIKHYAVKKIVLEYPNPYFNRTEKTASCFELSCQCGGIAFDIIHKSLMVDDIQSPLFTHCVNCGDQTLLFDSDIHGYNAINNCTTLTKGTDNERSWECSHCAAPGKIIVCCDYCYPLDDEVFLETNPEDWFDGFVVFHVCLTDQSIHWVAGYSCA